MPTLPHFPSIGALLRHARETARLSLKDLGEVLDYWPSYLSDVERGQRGAPRELCDQLSRTLGLDRVELYARAGHLSDAVLDYLGQTPRALLVLERLAEQGANDAQVGELLAWMEGRREQTADSRQQTAPDPESETGNRKQDV